MSKTLQDADREARKLVSNWTTGAALTGWIPGSAFFLTAADTAMIHQVAGVYGISAFDMDNLMAVSGSGGRQRDRRRRHLRGRRIDPLCWLGGEERGDGGKSQSDRRRSRPLLP